MRCRWDPVYPTSGLGSAPRPPPPGLRRRAERGGRASSPATSPTAGSTRPSSRPGWTGPWGPPPVATSTGLFDDLPRLADEPPPPRPRRRRLVSLRALVALVVVVAMASDRRSYVHFPWLLLVVVGLLPLAPVRAATTTPVTPARMPKSDR